MTTYQIMRARIADELARDDLTSQIQDAIKSAIAFYQNETFWFNQALDTSTSTVTASQSYNLPSDFLFSSMLESTESSTRSEVEPVSWRRFRELDNNSDQGSPLYYTLFGDGYRLWPTPDKTYSMELSYTKMLATLSASTDTNAWMTHGEMLIRGRAKADLLTNVIRDFDEAAAMKLLELEALRRLRGRHTGRVIGTGRLRGSLCG